MPGTTKRTSKRGGAAGGGRRKATTREPARGNPSMRRGIHPDDRELFSLAGIDWSDVPDLPTAQQQANGASQAQSNDDKNNRVIAFEDDEPDNFLACINARRDIQLTMPFMEAQKRKGSANQAEAAQKAGCSPPLFVYGSSLFPEVLCQQLGVPVASAMHVANNYIPAVAPYCTRYCLAGDVPLAAMVHHQDKQLNSYLKEPRKESHVRGALVFGLQKQSKQHLDKCYGAKPKDEAGEGAWGPWKRVAIGVRCQLADWDQPGWVVAETYIWTGSIARLRCFKQDLIWTPHIFAEFCQKKRSEAEAKGIEYKGPPLWTAEDAREWQKRRPAEIEEENKRMAKEISEWQKGSPAKIEEENKRRAKDIGKRCREMGTHGIDGVRRQMKAAHDGQMQAVHMRMKVPGAANLTHTTNKPQTDKTHLRHSTPTKTQNHHEDVEMQNAPEGSKQEEAAGAQKNRQRDDKSPNSSPSVC